jgi:hypothetical protein
MLTLVILGVIVLIVVAPKNDALKLRFFKKVASPLSSTLQKNFVMSRVTRLGNFSPIGLLLEAHYDFLKE